jgi:hypothetical protein
VELQDPAWPSARCDIPSFNIPVLPNSIVKVVYCSNVAGKKKMELEILDGFVEALRQHGREAIARLQRHVTKLRNRYISSSSLER